MLFKNWNMVFRFKRYNLMDIDSLKSVVIGSGGFSVQYMDFLPEIVKIGVGIATIVYFGYKTALIRKQLKE